MLKHIVAIENQLQRKGIDWKSQHPLGQTLQLAFLNCARSGTNLYIQYFEISTRGISQYDKVGFAAINLMFFSISAFASWYIGSKMKSE